MMRSEEPRDDGVDDAVHIAVDHGRRTLCGSDVESRITVGPGDPRPSNGDGCWMCLLIAGELRDEGDNAVREEPPEQKVREPER